MQTDARFAKSESTAPMQGRESSFGWRTVLTVALLLAGVSAAGFAQSSNSDGAFLPSPVTVASTVPANGDVNPYGVTFIPNNFQTGTGPLMHGDVLVSNFNNKTNVQGTGTTIVRFPADGTPPSLFYQASRKIGTVGLSTALATLQFGWVLVGNCPVIASSGTAGGPGALMFLNNKGRLIYYVQNPLIQAPWDITVIDQGYHATVFIANALNGTVARLTFLVDASAVKVRSAVTIASGYVNRPDPATFFVAPTGLVYDSGSDTLYVASTGDNAVYAIPHATTTRKDSGMGTLIYKDDMHLHGALGLAEAPNGHLLVTNSDGINSDPTQPSEIVEFTKQGDFVKQIPVDPAQGGSFGLAVNKISDNQAILAAVDDVTSTLIKWTVTLP
jgi:hypothetical protein